MTSSKPNCLPKAPFPNPIPLGTSAPTYDSAAGGQKHSVHGTKGHQGGRDTPAAWREARNRSSPCFWTSGLQNHETRNFCGVPPSSQGLVTAIREPRDFRFLQEVLRHGPRKGPSQSADTVLRDSLHPVCLLHPSTSSGPPTTCRLNKQSLNLGLQTGCRRAASDSHPSLLACLLVLMLQNYLPTCTKYDMSTTCHISGYFRNTDEVTLGHSRQELRLAAPLAGAVRLTPGPTSS